MRRVAAESWRSPEKDRKVAGRMRRREEKIWKGKEQETLVAFDCEAEKTKQRTLCR